MSPEPQGLTTAAGATAPSETAPAVAGPPAPDVADAAAVPAQSDGAPVPATSGEAPTAADTAVPAPPVEERAPEAGPVTSQAPPLVWNPATESPSRAGSGRDPASPSGLRRPKVRRRARRVTRVIRRIDLWSVLKLALVLYSCLYAATLAALAVIWAAAYSTGLVEKLQSFLGTVGLDNFRFYGDQMFRACAAIGAVLVLAGTLITVLTVALINLISELTGGIRIVVIEEEPWRQKREQLAVAEVQPLPSDPAAGL